MKNLLRFFSMMILVSLSLMAYAQPGPVCTDLNIPVGPDDSATIVVGDFVTNADASIPDITLENPYGGVLRFVPGATAATTIRIAACAYVSRELKLVAKNANGSCWSRITFKQSNGPIIVGRKVDVYCTDSLVEGGHINGVPPTAFLSCTGDVPATYVADWVDVYDCVLGEDTAKVIYRMYEAYDKFGLRGTGADTIIVYRLPQITPLNTWCVERDTTYCGDVADANFGPYMVVPTGPNAATCDTIYFLNPDGTSAVIDPKCGIAVSVIPEPFGEGCVSTIKYTVELKQSCYGSTSTTCTVPMGSQIETVADGYYRCVFWLMDIDTVPPIVDCGETDTLLVPTGGHDCAAHLLLPPVTAVDSCNTVVAVKASIEGYGSFAMSYQGGYWVSNQSIKIPYTDEVTQIIYEAFDECHNVGYDTCYIRVKDLVAPVAICDKGVNVSLTGKKTWVSAETFNEGSWDNCGINFLLARRSDWQETCIDLCDSVLVVGSSPYGTIYRPYLESNKALDEIEAHYAKVLQWLQWDGQECADIIYNAWRYDLMKYATLNCVAGDYHHFDFDEAVRPYFDPELDFAKVKQIGGGWAEDVLFTCDDACGPVTVEILVMDYWCNYNTCWTEVWVEDQTPISIPKNVTEEFDISCKTYKDANYTLGGLPVSIADLVAAADGGDEDAFDALDEIFGGYRKAWVDPYGKYVDIDGIELDCDIVFTDSSCICSTYTTQEPYYDEHFGWTYETVYHNECGYYATELDLTHGVVAVNCEKNVQCERDIWFDFDECGQGVIYRKFIITQGCPGDDLHSTEPLTRIQKIWVGNQCELNPGMFTVPQDTTLDVCDLVFDPEGSGNVAGAAAPENIGSAEYVFDDDCRLVGIGYYDKVFKVVGGDAACYKVIRTWCFADWCEVNKPLDNSWTVDPDWDDKVIKYEQKIILIDTTPPVISITPVGTDDVVSAGGCLYDFSTTVDVADACGVLGYRWMLFNGSGASVANGDGSLDLSIADNFEVAVAGLATGSYTLRVIVTDQCQNEGVGEYAFQISTEKKPAVVCITSLTVELTPMDLDNDGVIDTGMAVVWAEEFNSSSAPACNDDSIAFYIEYLDGDGDDILDENDADSLAIGCDVLPDAFMVRMWVKSFPSLTADYCDVMIVPQNNMQACGDISRIQSGVSGNIMTELETNVEQVTVKATLSSGQELDFLTTSAGAYSFASALGLDVTVTPVKDLDPMNGISTADLITIQKHIIGKTELKNSYRELAADVNNDQRITPLDLLVLRKLILGKIDKLPVNSWTFLNSINGKQDYTINSVNDHMKIDFTGVKMGDVNIDNDPSKSAGRTAHDLVLEVSDQKIEKGASYEIDVTAANFNDIEGYQFTLNVDPSSVQIRDIKMGTALDLTDDNFGLERVAEGIITTSWNAAQVKSLDPNEVLFTLVVEGVNETTMSNALAVTSKVTSAEAYTGSNELLGVAVRFEGSTVEQGFALYQNRPNPFKETTAIGFVLPESTDATLTVYDVTGKVLKIVEGSYTKGYNEISLQKSELNATGILYYQLDSDVFTATRKMVVID